MDGNPTAGLVHTSFDVIDGEGRVVRSAINWNRGQSEDHLERGADFIRKNMPSTSSVCMPTALIRRSCLTDPPYTVEMMPQPDLILWLNIALDHDVMYLAAPGAAFRTHDESYSTGWAVEYPNGMYVYEREIVVRLRDTKLLWIDRHASRLDDPAALRRAVLRAAATSCSRPPISNRIAGVHGAVGDRDPVAARDRYERPDLAASRGRSAARGTRSNESPLP